MSAIKISPEQERQIVRDAKNELVQHLITQHKDEFDYISPAQAAGILDVNPATMRTLKIPRYVLVPNKVIKYRLSEVLAYLQTTKE